MTKPSYGIEQLKALLERVEKAEGPDTELDLRISRTLYIHVMLTEKGPAPKPLTASIDAALGLVEEILPGQWTRILYDAMQDLATRHHWPGVPPKSDQLAHLPRALLSALLKALIAQHETEEVG